MFGRLSHAIISIAIAATIVYGLNRALLEGDNKEVLVEESLYLCSKQEMQDLLAIAAKETDRQSPYSITIPLLGSAYLKDRVKYDQWKKALYTAFKIDPKEAVEASVEKLKSKSSQNAWLLGRLLLANIKMKERHAAEKNSLIIEKLLKDSHPDPYAAWAWGYLAIYKALYEPHEFPEVKARMIDTTDALMEQPEQQGKDNVIWALVMELQSLAVMGDREGFEQRLLMLLHFTDTSSVVAALQTIPPEDFRAWATSLTLSAAKKINDQHLVDDLAAYFPIAVETSSSDGDKMLSLSIYCH